METNETPKKEQGFNRPRGPRRTRVGGTVQRLVRDTKTGEQRNVGKKEPLMVENITAEEFMEGAGRPARKSLTATKTPKEKRKGTFVGDFWKRLSDPSKYTQNWKAGAQTIARTYPTPTRTRPEKGLDIFRPGSVRIAEQIAKERKNRRGR